MIKVWKYMNGIKMFEPTTQSQYETEVKLATHLQDFRELKCVYDKSEEKRVIRECLKDLSNYVVIQQGTYAEALFRNAYGGYPEEIETDGNSYVDIHYRVSNISEMSMSVYGAMELIKLIVQYAKTKGHDIYEVMEE